jgi:DNA polymerase-1
MDSNGSRCGGSIGTLKSVRKLLNDLRPDNVLMVWDGEGGSQRRRSIMSEYKAGRKVRLNRKDDFGESAEEDLHNLQKQYHDCQDYLGMLGVPQVRAPNVEADDLIAHLSINAVEDVLIVTTDQDLLQLIRDRGVEPCVKCNEPYRGDSRCADCTVLSEVKVWSPIKGKLYDRQRFLSEYGVLPENYRLMKALTGDASDNIKGIKGFGIKTIAKSFPFLAERKAKASEILEVGKGLKGALGKSLTDGESKFKENMQLVDLSEPMLSADAARQAREALVREMPVRELDLRVRMVRDGTSVSDADKLVSPFRQLAVRRKRLISG